MNLIISGDDLQNLAKVEALARKLGLVVSREVSGASLWSGKSRRQTPEYNSGETAEAENADRKIRTFLSQETGPLYGIE